MPLGPPRNSGRYPFAISRSPSCQIFEKIRRSRSNRIRLRRVKSSIAATPSSNCWGLNPSPLAHFHDRDGCFPSISVLCSSDSEPEFRQFKIAIEEKVGTVLCWDQHSVQPSSAAGIERAVAAVVPGPEDRVHFHYSGGAKAMVYTAPGDSPKYCTASWR